MKRGSRNKDQERSQYDFYEGVGGKYAARSNIVILSPELAEIFPDSEAVNEALRTLLRLSERRAMKARKRPRKAARGKPASRSRPK